MRESYAIDPSWHDRHMSETSPGVASIVMSRVLLLYMLSVLLDVFLFHKGVDPSREADIGV